VPGLAEETGRRRASAPSPQSDFETVPYEEEPRPRTPAKAEVVEEPVRLTPAAVAPIAPAPKRRGSGWMGSAAGGLIAGTAACFALWLFGIEPPTKWRIVGGETPSTNKPGPGPGPGPGAGAVNPGAVEPPGGERPATVQDLRAHVRN